MLVFNKGEGSRFDYSHLAMQINDFWQWLQRRKDGVLALIVFITTVTSFIQFLQGNAGLATWLLLSLGIALVWLACLYFARFWKPEKADKTAAGFSPDLTPEQKAAQARKIKQRKKVRWLAKAGLVVVPILATAGYLGWQHVQGLPSQTVTILVADFEGPDPQNYRVTETILMKLRDSTEDFSEVKVVALEEQITEQAGSDVARAKG
ncbi:MAG: hypothetical protein AAF528_05440 [Cyanobacteria bacterium P01_C01_bin.121]